MRTNTTTEHKQWLWRFNLQIFSTDSEDTEAQLDSTMYWILPGLWYFCSADFRFAAVVSEQIETVCSNVQQPLTRNTNYSGTSDPAEERSAQRSWLHIKHLFCMLTYSKRQQGKQKEKETSQVKWIQKSLVFWTQAGESEGSFHKLSGSINIWELQTTARV